MGRARNAPTLRRIPVPQPAAGANFSQVNDSGGHWLLQAIMFRLVTSAVVANRTAALLATAGEDRWFATAIGGNQTATTTVDYAAWAGSPTALTTGPIRLFALPTPGLLLPPGHVLASDVGGLDVGDQLSAIFLSLVEYPEVLPEHFYPTAPTAIEDDQG